MARTNAVRNTPAFPAGALRLPSAAERLAQLLAAEERCLKKLERTRAQLEKLQCELRALTAKMEAANEPLIEKCRVLDEQIHEVFTQLLAPDSELSKRARPRVQRCYESLQMSGFLSDRRPQPQGDDDIFGSAFAEAAGRSEFSDFCPDIPRSADAHKGRCRQASRDLFRKLAEQLHPDKCQTSLDVNDRLRREDAMKEATIAYREGDLSKLMLIEKAWLDGCDLPRRDRGDLAARCCAMKARIEDLILQERALRCDLRDLRQVPEIVLLRDIKRFGETEVFARLAEDLQAEAEDLRESLNVAQDFAAKRIRLEEFLAGPALFTSCDDEFDDPYTMKQALEDYLGSFCAGPVPGANKSARSNKTARASAKK